MKLLPSWRAVLPMGLLDRSWPWAQQPRSRWALGGLGLGQHRGEQNQGPQAQPPPGEEPQALRPSQTLSASSRPHGQAGVDPPGGKDRLDPGLVSEAM